MSEDRKPMFLAGGRWMKPSGTETNPVVNPATGEVIAVVTSCNADDVDAAVAAAAQASEAWSALPMQKRLDHLRRLRGLFASHADELANLVTQQMGSPIGFSKTAQIGLPLRTFDIVIDAAERLQEDVIGRSAIVREAVGVVAAITPWNFPLHQIAAKIVPALAAGCSVVLKPSEVTPLDAILFAEIVEKAGLPDGVFNLVLGGAVTGKALVEHPLIAMVSFTGSTAAGRAIGAVAGGHLKKMALELGGKSANIMLDDIDVAAVVPQAIGQCFVNAGQTCAALTRLLVSRQHLAVVEEAAAAALAGWQPNDPAQVSTRMGPLSSRRQRDRVAAMVFRAVEEGARFVGPEPDLSAPEDLTAFFPPVILSDVRSDMEIAQEEVFGPVLVLIPYDDEDEAVRLANDTSYGLSGGVWSIDQHRAEAVARRLHTGQVILNGAMLDMEAPFGGIGQSGVGRENGLYGLEEFFSHKAITRPAQN